MPNASLLKLDMQRLIESQEVRIFVQKKALAVCMGCFALAVYAGVTDFVHGYVATGVGVLLVALFGAGWRSLRKLQRDLEANRKALKEVYEATG